MVAEYAGVVVRCLERQAPLTAKRGPSLALVGFEDGARKEPNTGARIGEDHELGLGAERGGNGAAHARGEDAAIGFGDLVDEYEPIPLIQALADVGDEIVLEAGRGRTAVFGIEPLQFLDYGSATLAAIDVAGFVIGRSQATRSSEKASQI